MADFVRNFRNVKKKSIIFCGLFLKDELLCTGNFVGTRVGRTNRHLAIVY